MVFITKYRAANAEYHRPMSLHQGLERQFACLPVSRHEPIEKLVVGDVADHPFIEEGRGVPPEAAV
jgi:hypothetical protein